MSLTRREFLSVVGAGFVGWKAGLKIDEVAPERVDYSGNQGEKDRAKLLEDIKRYRKMWELDPLPQELVSPVVLSDEIWNGGSKSMFWNELNGVDALVGTRTEEILRTILGKRYCQLIRGVRVDPLASESISFNWVPGSRMINLSKGIGTWATDGGVLDYILHEGIGHGTDPALLGGDFFYSYGALLHIEHGKWRALSQASKVEGKFLNDKGDLEYQILERNVGGVIGRSLVEGGLEKLLKGELSTDLSRLMFSGGKFTKQRCTELGGLILDEVRAGRLSLVGEAEKVYKDSLEDIFVEIYAEMIKNAIFYPEKIKYNIQIMEGVREIVSIIRGEDTNLDAIKSQLLTHGDKTTLVSSNESKVNVEVAGWMAPVPEGDNNIPSQTDVDMEYAFFAGRGETPKGFVFGEQDRVEFVEFATLYTQFVSKYPVLKNYVPYEYRKDFDPQGLNMWETREIEVAMDSTFLRLLFTDKKNLQKYMSELIDKKRVLEKFVNRV